VELEGEREREQQWQEYGGSKVALLVLSLSLLVDAVAELVR